MKLTHIDTVGSIPVARGMSYKTPGGSAPRRRLPQISHPNAANWSSAWMGRSFEASVNSVWSNPWDFFPMVMQSCPVGIKLAWENEDNPVGFVLTFRKIKLAPPFFCCTNEHRRFFNRIHNSDNYKLKFWLPTRCAANPGVLYFRFVLSTKSEAPWYVPLWKCAVSNANWRSCQHGTKVAHVQWACHLFTSLHNKTQRNDQTLPAEKLDKEMGRVTIKSQVEERKVRVKMLLLMMHLMQRCIICCAKLTFRNDKFAQNGHELFAHRVIGLLLMYSSQQEVICDGLLWMGIPHSGFWQAETNQCKTSKGNRSHKSYCCFPLDWIVLTVAPFFAPSIRLSSRSKQTPKSPKWQNRGRKRQRSAMFKGSWNSWRVMKLK